jgi:hypothetical protein
MVTVSPARGKDVTITVLRAGRSALRLVAGAATMELVITATFEGGILTVQIAQGRAA